MSEKIEQTYQVLGPARLEVSNLRGSTKVRSGGENIVRVEAVKQDSTGDEKRTQIQLSQEADGTVKVKTHFPEASHGWLLGSQPCLVDYVITAPRQCRLQISGVSSEMEVIGFEGEASIHSVSGDTVVRDVSGPVRLNTVSGDLELANLAGSLIFETVSGDVRGEKLSGSLDLNTVSGDVNLKASNLPSVKATTVSGEIELETALGEGPYRFNSVSGDVALKVPEGTQCTAELSTLSGDLETDIKSTSISRTNGTRRVEVQGGGVKVSLHSVSGDMEISS